MSQRDGSPLQGRRILLVEDEYLIAALAQDMLTDLGATVLGPAATVPKALALAAAADMDAAVLDMNLCGVMVDDVAEALRTRRIPFVLATGYGEAALLRSHTGPTLSKPYTKEMLADALGRVLAPTPDARPTATGSA